MNPITKAKIDVFLKSLCKKHDLSMKIYDDSDLSYKHYIRVSDGHSHYDQYVREKNLSNFKALELNLEYAISVFVKERQKNDYRSC
jgi:hypothetical protein